MNSRRGSAYILVIVAALVALALTLTVLTITAASRGITARYPDFFGLYDIAAAGNEHAFAALETALENRAAANADVFANFFVYRPQECFHRPVQCGTVWRYEWTFGINFADERNDFSAITTICERGVTYPCREICPRLRAEGWHFECVPGIQCAHGTHFVIRTRVRQICPDAELMHADVRKSAIFLDCNTLVMLELSRIAD